MRDAVVVSRAEVRAAILAAIAQQWNRDIADQTERSPRGHQEALADAVMAIIPIGDVRING